MVQEMTFDPHDVVTRYFEYIRELRNGQQDAVEKLVDLWDDEGVFEFAGAPPVSGTYKGKNAIHVLYKNRVSACGMPLTLVGDGSSKPASALAAEIALGVVDTKVNRMRTLATGRPTTKSKMDSRGQRVAVGWTTVIGTGDKRGFEVTGNHAFTFMDGKISSLKVTVSPKAEDTPGLSLQGLAVADIGRLSLAAWAVV
ncbi:MULTISPECIES: hypothetical protein [unclassified Mesorhizobium]|uniref:hypothetical protein n=1 Tax=unclassified Mesorhizobium TaxID=325217 RepID=UPI0010936937|nr:MULTISPECIES: hypothetical protein [unclassified Mesorhizobium]TGQ72911.1 hypothetical protein EN848_06175 [bacterium M00.F.Ca.ET.205.01.1.1]TGU53668.1 hypothetical protein EN795_10595 [bacterium M00.F.Ca.ET.152.01.1.1]TGV37166.1 hypothetical protein EN829_010620 [Mesorhizobium sp. M00.F.Ca.ET.186.01.1.1]TGZ39465.1 hypothetical protein EN805_29395 [bacterium M00.F.Ca.ET.162.01.1.1]TGT92078.1 hypothetical protein EN804_03210 [Mesorhizobium sp. M8A.F.Ca.ET.161.01.1.1]